MTGALVSIVVALAFGAAEPGAKMTYQEAKQRLQPRELPEFWIGDVRDLPARWEKLTRGKVRVIAKSPGGRLLHLITYGSWERVRRQANFNSAVGGADPSAYMDKKARKKPVVYFVGPVHGHEVEGLTGLVNLVQVMETGRDLRGRDQPELQKLGRQCRLLIVPTGNPDGTARFEPRAAQGMSLDEFRFWGQGTWSDDTIAVWPEAKRHHPRIGKEIGWLGCYFNDRGVNPMHDEFFAPMGPEAPAILRVAMQEGPDLAVSLHSHGYGPMIILPTYAPMDVKREAFELVKQYDALLAERRLPRWEFLTRESASTPQPELTAQPEEGQRPRPFNLVSAIYHVSGATTFTHECPHGLGHEKACQASFEQILDVELGLYEVMLRHALARKRQTGR